MELKTSARPADTSRSAISIDVSIVAPEKGDGPKESSVGGPASATPTVNPSEPWHPLLPTNLDVGRIFSKALKLSKKIYGA